MSKDRVKQQFGANAAAYATSAVHAKGASLTRLVELIAPQPDWHVLDIATAAGHTAFAMAPHVAHVVASDLTPEMLPVAETLAIERNITNVGFEIADAEALPFDDARFDLVTCRIAPHHFPAIDRFLAESARVLKPGGILAVVDNVVPDSEPTHADVQAQVSAGQYVNDFERLRDPSHHRALTVREWLSGFEAAGFKIIQHEVADKEMEFLPWAERMGATPETIQQLHRLLLDSPPAVRNYFRPRQDGATTYFMLQEAIITGRKP